MAVLNIHLVRKFDADRMAFGESWLGTTGMILMEYFKTCLAGTHYSSVDYWWSSAAGSVTDFDLVCYLLEEHSDSVLVKEGGFPASELGPSGATAWSKARNAMMCEIYLLNVVRGGDRRGGADGARDWAVANTVFHELMHSRLDAGFGKVIQDVHAIPGGVLGTSGAIDSSMRASDADKAAMRRGLLANKSGIKQFTGSM